MYSSSFHLQSDASEGELSVSSSSSGDESAKPSSSQDKSKYCGDSLVDDCANVLSPADLFIHLMKVITKRQSAKWISNFWLKQRQWRALNQR